MLSALPKILIIVYKSGPDSSPISINLKGINKFLAEMQSRGYLNQCTDLEKLDKICSSKSISGYIGFDCTAESLHVGS